MDRKDMLGKCDSTLLGLTATGAEIRSICDDGMKYGCASVCSPACYVKQAGMQTLAQPYFMPSSQMARISSQVAVWASRVWSHLDRISCSSIKNISLSYSCPWSLMTRFSRMPRM